MSSLELLWYLREDPDRRDIPVLVVSGRADRETVAEIRSLGARFVPKPFHAVAIVGEVKNLLEAT